MLFETARCRVHVASPDHALALSAFHLRNAAQHAAWAPRQAEGYHAPAAWEARLSEQQADVEAGRRLPMLAEAKEQPGEIAAFCNLSNIVRGAFQACHLGYAVDAALEGKGIMREVVSGVLDHAFGPMALHRVMANYIPANVRSGALLRRLGFEREGYARNYLKIDGRWQDHILTSLTAEDWARQTR